MSDYYFPNATIQIFCKAPVPGQVKTRLMPELTAEQAANVHQQLSIRMITKLSQFKLCPLQLWCSPDKSHPFFQEIKRSYNLSLHVQTAADLGLRMFNSLKTGSNNHQPVILIGCDCPSLNKDDFINAIKALENSYDVVIAPCEDGGYSLIGLNKPQIGLFENMSWGNSKVLETTLARIKTLGLNYYQLRQQWDVDTAIDWRRYCLENGTQNIENKFN